MNTTLTIIFQDFTGQTEILQLVNIETTKAINFYNKYCKSKFFMSATFTPAKQPKQPK
jgi:hypothetical protein